MVLAAIRTRRYQILYCRPNFPRSSILFSLSHHTMSTLTYLKPGFCNRGVNKLQWIIHHKPKKKIEPKRHYFFFNCINHICLSYVPALLIGVKCYKLKYVNVATIFRRVFFFNFISCSKCDMGSLYCYRPIADIKMLIKSIHFICMIHSSADFFRPF